MLKKEFTTFKFTYQHAIVITVKWPQSSENKYANITTIMIQLFLAFAIAINSFYKRLLM